MNPAEPQEYRFRPELVHRRAALSTFRKILARERVKPATVELRRNRALTTSWSAIIVCAAIWFAELLMIRAATCAPVRCRRFAHNV